jgi:hypothetical protein
MENATRIRVIDLVGFSESIHTIKNQIGLTAMAKIAIPADLVGMFAAGEDAYEQATREGYAENPAVIAAVTALKSAWKAFHVANYNLMTAKGFFPVEIAALRRDRACRATRKACTNLHAAIAQAAAENRLYNRCLVLASADQGSAKPPGGTRSVA